MIKASESGATAFVTISSISCLFLASLFVEQISFRSKSNVQESKTKMAAEEKQTGALSAISHYKSLVSPKRRGETWKPALYAQNYFDSLWKMRASSTQVAKFNQINSEMTAIKLRKPMLNAKDVEAIISGYELKNEAFNVKFLKPNFDANERLVESIDIEVSSRDTMKGEREPLKILARVPLPEPVPYDPQLLYRRPGGMWAEVTDGVDLSNGPFEFIAKVSGIAFDGALLVNGSSIKNQPIFGGRNENGRVDHQAVNYENVGGLMGPAYLFDPGPGEIESPSDSKEGGSYSEDGTSCGFKKGSYEDGLTKGNPSLGVTPKSVTLQLVVTGPGGSASAVSTPIFKAKVGKGGGRGRSEADGAVLTAEDYKNSCQTECPYIGDGETGAEIGGYAGFKGEGPISSRWTMREAQEKWGIMDKKVCFKFPGAPKPGYDQHDSEVWAYDPKTCKGEKLFKRGACGCLTGDTKILLGDGKTEKRIDEMTKWDRAWNPILKRSFAVRKYTAGPEGKPLVRLDVGGETLNATSDHPFLTRVGLKTASEITTEDSIRMASGSWEKVGKVTSIPVPEIPPTVWNLELDAPDEDIESHYVVANGIVTGDLFIQMSLKKEE